MPHCAHVLRFQDAKPGPKGAEVAKIPFLAKGAPRFSAPRGTEAELGRRLREVARFTGSIVRAHVGKDGLKDELGMLRALDRYAEAVVAWADPVVTTLLDQVGTSNLRHWENASVDLGRKLRTTYAKSEIGRVARELHTRQLGLIRSLPTQAGTRAQYFARKAQLGGQRPSAITEAIAELDRTGEVTVGRATLIARTEISKANASFTESRSRFIGATHYIWRGMLDNEERDSHFALEGEVFGWDDPPFVDDDEGAHHPGDIWNCRCFAEPIITGLELDQRLEALYNARATAGLYA